MKTIILTLFLIFSHQTTLYSQEKANCELERGWEINYLNYKKNKIRTGLYRTQAAEVKGHIIYLQGLGDSMMNHFKIFNSLKNSGFNVIAFNYMGQCCSEGSMNKTTIKNIGKLADIVWDYYVKKSEKKKIIG